MEFFQGPSEAGLGLLLRMLMSTKNMEEVEVEEELKWAGSRKSKSTLQKPE